MNKRGRQSLRTGAESVKWDMADLYRGADDPSIDRDLEEARKRAQEFNKRWKGNVSKLSIRDLSECVRRYEEILEKIQKVKAYAYLLHSTDSMNPTYGALLQRLREEATSIYQMLIFFELEWASTKGARAAKLLKSKRLSRYRHFLRKSLRYRPHLLSEPEERILAEKSVTGSSAWSRLFDQLISEIPFVLHGRRVTAQQLLSRLYEPNRRLRRAASVSLTRGLQSRLSILTYIFNMVAADKAMDDRLRNYPHWLSQRNLDNEASDETVKALVGSVVSCYRLPIRYFNLKRRLLGYEILYDYDRYAPVGAAISKISWERSRALILDAFGAFSARMAQLAERFYTGRWIHASIQKGKYSGAFSHPVVPSHHPYILLNYTGSARDVMTLAHELGHGVHQLVSAPQGYLNSKTPLTTAETASSFAEMLVFNSLLENQRDKKARLSLLCGKIEDILATVFRQVAMHRFEEEVHTHRRQKGELSAEEFCRLWLGTQKAMHGDEVVLTENYSCWWSYIPHFIHTPGYVYAYAFGELLVMALIARYRKTGAPFVDLYMEILAAGGSESPEELISKAGLEISDPRFWQQGLRIIEEMIEEAEAIGKSLR